MQSFKFLIPIGSVVLPIVMPVIAKFGTSRPFFYRGLKEKFQIYLTMPSFRQDPVGHTAYEQQRCKIQATAHLGGFHLLFEVAECLRANLDLMSQI